MNLRVVREPSDPVAGTPGVFFVDGRFHHFTLEDIVREVAGQPVAAWKIAGDTAIPAGRYRVAMTFSNRFQRVTPEILNVSGFAGIRIHAGNTKADTEGCLLLGLQRAGASVVQSRPAVAELEALITAALERHEDVWIDVENPPGYSAAA
jgi:hypothetical protein